MNESSIKYHIKHPSTSIISRSVLHFADKLCNESDIDYLNRVRTICGWGGKFSSEVDELPYSRKKTACKLYDHLVYQMCITKECEYTVKFNGNYITIRICPYEDPFPASTGCVDIFEYYADIYLSASSNSIIESFLHDSRIFYENFVMGHNNSGKVINCMLWDDYWELADKFTKRSISTIYLPENQASTVLSDIQKFLLPETERKYIDLGIPYKRVYLLEGPPGSGKTSLITSIASEIDFGISFLTFNKDLDDLSIMRAIRKIGDNNVLVIEDVDCLFSDKKNKSGASMKLTFSGILNTFDGLCRKHGLIIFLTTNHLEILKDDALLRPGRIDYKVKFDYADEYQIKTITRKFLPDISDDMIVRFYKKIKSNQVKM